MGASVVDANTKKPLDGVIVVAFWKLERGTLGGNVDIGTLHVMEAVTDKDGLFNFPAWGPKTVWRGFLSGHSPTILFFKPGYRWEKRYPQWEGKTAPDPRTHWSGKTIELSKFEGGLQRYAEHISDLSRKIDSILNFSRKSNDCQWQNTPRMLVMLHNMSLDFEKKGINLFGSHVLRLDDIPVDQQCGSPKQFLGKYFL